MIDGFRPEVLTVTGGEGWLTSMRVPVDLAEQEPSAVGVSAVPAVPAVIGDETTAREPELAEQPGGTGPGRDPRWDRVIELLDPEEPELTALAHTLASAAVPVPQDGYELDGQGWQAELAWPDVRIGVVRAPRPTGDEPDYEAEDQKHAFTAERPATVVTTTDEDLRGALESGDFGRWKSFLHPTQAKLVERRYSGPARVGGGPGTGKTVVALHRVRHLIRQLSPGHDKPVLLTTFNKNLAADLRSRLLELGGDELLSRVEVSHVDQLALRVVREAEPGNGKQAIDDGQAVREWRALLDELGEDTWDPEFLHEEWTQVILGQAVGSRTDYFRARRAGRGKSIGRAERAEIWQLAERFTQRLDRLGRQTWDQIAERAARTGGTPGQVALA